MFQEFRRKKSYIYLGIGFLLTTAIYQIHSFLTTNEAAKGLKHLLVPNFCPNLKDYLAPIEHCLVQNALADGSNLWINYNRAVKHCANQKNADAFGVQNVSNIEERKGFIPMERSLANTKACTIVTLGIGNDIASETKMKRLAPECRFFGADPILDSGKVFESLGTYDQVAVTTEDGEAMSNVLKEGTYVWENMPTVSLISYLNKHNIRFIDNLLIDNEGPEYQLLPYLHRDGPLAQAGITVCQINVEVHGLPEKYGFPNDQFDLLMLNFWNRSPYWPVLSSQLFHNRYYFVNFENTECLNRYVPAKYC